MKRKMNRRRVKKRRHTNEKTKMKFTAVLVIIIIAIALGYVTAKCVIGPILGYDANESPIQIAGQDNTVSEDDSNDKKDDVVEDNDKYLDSGYALQFGAFSTKEAAQELVNELSKKGVETKILDEDGIYKVISPIINTKAEAINKLNDVKDKEVTDVFIASF